MPYRISVELQTNPPCVPRALLIVPIPSKKSTSSEETHDKLYLQQSQLSPEGASAYAWGGGGLGVHAPNTPMHVERQKRQATSGTARILLTDDDVGVLAHVCDGSRRFSRCAHCLPSACYRRSLGS